MDYGIDFDKCCADVGCSAEQGREIVGLDWSICTAPFTANGIMEGARWV